MKIRYTVLPACAAALLSTAAMAQGINNNPTNPVSSTIHQAKDAIVGDRIENLPTRGEVTISGKVSNFDSSDNTFTVRDATGSVEVESDGPVNVRDGDNVVVSGRIIMDGDEKQIYAKNVTVSETAAESVRD